jgi:Rrf2 family transcriptional regulator, iron-sulfur cluster assembly transcription factor
LRWLEVGEADVSRLLPKCLLMPLLPRKNVLAIVAVTDIALHARKHPVAARALAARHRLPPRLLEPVLQALVRHGILRGTRGPHGGYALARDQRRITADEILRAARSAENEAESAAPDFPLLREVVAPALAQAESAFSDALARISVEDLTLSASDLRRARE